MSDARRNDLNGALLDSSHHAGLVLDCYLEKPAASEQSGDKGGAKKKLHQQTQSSLQNLAASELYEVAFERWKKSLPDSSSAVHFCCKCLSHLLIGLGGENVTETGLTLHHTYGVPYLPGSALKGLAARYASEVWGSAEPTWRKGGKHHETMFGTNNAGGLVAFLDGWIMPSSVKKCLHQDVMTPHHRRYYIAEENAIHEPTDFDVPVPVSMLSITGAFHVAIVSLERTLPVDWLQTAETLLTLALEEWGIGAKTSSGYGRFKTTHLKVSHLSQSDHSPKKAVPSLNVGDDKTATLTGKSNNGNWKAELDAGLGSGSITNTDELLRSIPRKKQKKGTVITVKIIMANNLQNLELRYLKK